MTSSGPTVGQSGPVEGAVLVTGASGFLGRWVAADLARSGRRLDVVALRRGTATSEELALPTGTHLMTGDVREDGWLDAAARQPLEAIVHGAALVRHSRRNAGELFEVNVGGTLRLVRLAARTGARLIFVSTSGTVGCSADQGARPDESAPFCEREARRWPYYASKIEAEKRARALADELGVELVIVRPPVMLGPGDVRFRSTGHLARLLRRRIPFLVRGDIHFVDVRDVSAALVRLVSLARPRPIYHLPGSCWSIPELFAVSARIADVPVPRLTLSPTLGRAVASLVSGLGRALGRRPGWLIPDPVVFEMASWFWGLSSSHAERDLAFRPRPAEATLADTIAWIRENLPDAIPSRAVNHRGKGQRPRSWKRWHLF